MLADDADSHVEVPKFTETEHLSRRVQELETKVVTLTSNAFAFAAVLCAVIGQLRAQLDQEKFRNVALCSLPTLDDGLEREGAAIIIHSIINNVLNEPNEAEQLSVVKEKIRLVWTNPRT